MKKYIFRIYLVVTGLLVTATMQSQSLKSLEDNNGFKKYKLGSKFVLGLGVKHRDEDGADKVVIDYANEMIGDIPVKTIELYYLKDTLAKIIVRVTPEYHDKLFEAVKNSFGQPTQDISFNEKVKLDSTIAINSFKDDYLWRATRIRLEYYYSYPKTSGGAYGIKNLYLAYTLNDFPQRLLRVKRSITSAKNF